jgi:hypothetical protein
MRLFLFWFICSLFVSTVIGAPMTLLTPSNDPFYKGPDGFESKPVGTVLNWRVTPHKLRSLYFPIDIQNSWDILVRSEDAEGNPIAVVSTIIEPYNSDPTKLVAYNIAQDSSSFDCSPTYAILQGAPVFPNLEVEFEFSLMGCAALLSEGYYVVTTNYETTTNYTAAFTAGRLAGHNILNSLRGVLTTGNFTGLDNPDIILWGYSGGALASGWTAALMNAYAPELEDLVIGAALGGLPANITETILATDGGLFAGLIATGVTGLSNQYPALREVVKKAIVPSKYSDYIAASKVCLVSAIFDYADDHFFVGKANETYCKTGLEILHDPVVADIIMENTLAVNKSEVPQVPLFLYHGELDQIVPYVNSNRSYTNWCASGAPSIEFASDITGGHITEIIVGAPGAAAWIKNTFNGIKPKEGCHKTEYLTMFEYPGTSKQLTDIAKNLLNVVLDAQVGPSNMTKRDMTNLYNEGLLADEVLARRIYEKSKQF